MKKEWILSNTYRFEILYVIYVKKSNIQYA